MQKKQNRRSPITLFEVLIVMTLIAMALGAVSFQFSKAFKGEQFERSVDLVIDKISLAQELMLDFHTDVEMEIGANEEGVLCCTLSITRPLPPHLTQSLNRHCSLKGIEKVTFNGKNADVCSLHFDGSLGIIPTGALSIFGKDKREILILNGYPAQIKRGVHGQIQISQAVYPQEILSSP